MRLRASAGFVLLLLVASGGSVSRLNVKAETSLERFEEVKDWPRLPPAVPLGEVSGVAVDVNGEAAQLVRPLVERAAGAEVEARVVPVAGEDPVVDRPAVQREAHVRAAVVDGVDRVSLGEQADRVAIEAHDEPPLRAKLVERRRPCGQLARCHQ